MSLTSESLSDARKMMHKRQTNPTLAFALCSIVIVKLM